MVIFKSIIQEKPEAKAGKKRPREDRQCSIVGGPSPYMKLIWTDEETQVMGQKQQTPDGQLYGSSGATNPSPPSALDALPESQNLTVASGQSPSPRGGTVPIDRSGAQGSKHP